MDKFAHLHAHFKAYVDFTTADFEHFVGHLNPIQLKAKEIWQLEGRRSTNFAFLNSGLMRSYRTPDGEERSEEFYLSPDWVGDYASYLNGEISPLNYQALEASELFTIPFATMERLYKILPVGEEFSRLISQQRLIEAQARISTFLTKSPMERYLQLQQDRPELLERVPQYYIAQYLGIKAESLSRIRKRLADPDLS